MPSGVKLAAMAYDRNLSCFTGMTGAERDPWRRALTKPRSGDIAESTTCGLMYRSKQHLYSTTSSARISKDSGTVKPSSLAVFRLITSSNLVGCSTGVSAGEDDINWGFNLLGGMLCKLIVAHSITVSIVHKILTLDETVPP